MAKINRHGFIEAPYRKIDSKKITNSIEYLSADDEDRANIAQSGLESDKNNLISESKVRVRSKGDFPIVDSEDVQYSDIVPNQILSVAAALIPFVEHDDANRALMGSNMQRQSVPLLKTDSPIVGTGMEKVVARDSKSVLLSPVNGKVVHVDANKVVIKDPSVSNISPKVTVNNGTGTINFEAHLDSNNQFNSITLAVDFNKLMVPSPPVYELDDNGNFIVDPITNQPKILKGKDPNRSVLSGIFSSFSDAPDGFSEELKEITISSGVEYWYRDVFALRGGYFFENIDKGGRKFLTLGAGLKYNNLGLDFSYLSTVENDHPLAETMRFSISFIFDKEETFDDLSNK